MLTLLNCNASARTPCWVRGLLDVSRAARLRRVALRAARTSPSHPASCQQAWDSMILSTPRRPCFHAWRRSLQLHMLRRFCRWCHFAYTGQQLEQPRAPAVLARDAYAYTCVISALPQPCRSKAIRQVYSSPRGRKVLPRLAQNLVEATRSVRNLTTMYY